MEAKKDVAATKTGDAAQFLCILRSAHLGAIASGAPVSDPAVFVGPDSRCRGATGQFFLSLLCGTRRNQAEQARFCSAYCSAWFHPILPGFSSNHQTSSVSRCSGASAAHAESQRNLPIPVLGIIGPSFSILPEHYQSGWDKECPTIPSASYPLRNWDAPKNRL